MPKEHEQSSLKGLLNALQDAELQNFITQAEALTPKTKKSAAIKDFLPENILICLQEISVGSAPKESMISDSLTSKNSLNIGKILLNLDKLLNLLNTLREKNILLLNNPEITNNIISMLTTIKMNIAKIYDQRLDSENSEMTQNTDEVRITVTLLRNKLIKEIDEDIKNETQKISSAQASWFATFSSPPDMGKLNQLKEQKQEIENIFNDTQIEEQLRTNKNSLIETSLRWCKKYKTTEKTGSGDENSYSQIMIKLILLNRMNEKQQRLQKQILAAQQKIVEEKEKKQQEFTEKENKDAENEVSRRKLLLNDYLLNICKKLKKNPQLRSLNDVDISALDIEIKGKFREAQSQDKSIKTIWRKYLILRELQKILENTKDDYSTRINKFEDLLTENPLYIEILSASLTIKKYLPSAMVEPPRGLQFILALYEPFLAEPEEIVSNKPKTTPSKST